MTEIERKAHFKTIKILLGIIAFLAGCFGLAWALVIHPSITVPTMLTGYFAFVYWAIYKSKMDELS